MGKLVVVALVVLAAGCSDPRSGGNGGGGSSQADRYVEDYGGSRAVYTEILAGTSCDTLQATFNRAAGNNDTAEPGSAEAEWTTGYMVAADTRMQVIGCY